MNIHHERHISNLSTSQLVSSVQKTQYSTLAGVITTLNISGQNLLTWQNLSEFEVNIKFGSGNPHLKQFKTFLNHVRTKPEDIFSLKPSLKPKTFRDSESRGVSELQAAFASRQSVQSTPGQQSRPSLTKSNEIRLNSTTVSQFTQRISQEENTQRTSVQQKPKIERKPLIPQVTRQSFRTSAPKPSKETLPISFPGTPLNNSSRKPYPNNEEFPEYINIREHRKLPTPVYPPDYPPQEEEHEFSEYVNTPPKPVQENPYPKAKHLLDDPKERRQLEAALTRALKEMQDANTQPEEIYSSVAEDEDPEDDDEGEDNSQNSAESFESIGNAPPVRPHKPPLLPERPDEIFKMKFVKKIKERDSLDDAPPSPAITEMPTTTNQQTPVADESTSKQPIYEKLPKPRPVPPVVTNHSPVAMPDDNNEYEEPVVLDSPQYTIRRNMFFRDVTRDEGAQILMRKPIGTFLLRSSKTYLAVLMFRGRQRMNNMPVCYDEQTSQYYLSPPPGTVSTIKFNNMIKLLNFYERNSPSTAGDVLLNIEINNINS